MIRRALSVVSPDCFASAERTTFARCHLRRTQRSGRALFVSSWLFLTASLVLPTATHASGRVLRKHRGSIVLLSKRAPMRFRNDGLFLRFLKKHRVKHVWPSDKKTQKNWRLEFFAFFKRQTNDVEVKVKFFDITEGKRFIAGDSIYTPQRGQRILASNILLEKPKFAVDRKYAMYITTGRGNLLATTTFWLRGKRESYSGKVTFSEEEAK